MAGILEQKKHIHLIGVGGVGMSGLAMLLRDKGYYVTGSDVKEGFYLNTVRDYGVKVFIGHRKTNIDGADLVCYSSAVKEDNVELSAARDRDTLIMRRAALLGEIARDRKIVAVSGSHGKTTTSALITFLLKSMGYSPAAFIGAQSIDYGRSSWWGGDPFVIEADESDGSFLSYNPDVALITNIDREHMDFYGSGSALNDYFFRFASGAKKITIGCADCPAVNSILKKVNSLGYGIHNTASPVRAKNIVCGREYTVFDLIVREKEYRKVRISIPGEYNVLNALAAISFFSYLKEDMDKLLSKLIFFKGTRRRFQVRYSGQGIVFVDDYAHHPTEIKAVLKTARTLAEGRLIAVFQPHRFSRVNDLFSEFTGCFRSCDLLIATDIYPAGEERPSGFDESLFYGELGRKYPGRFLYVPSSCLAGKLPVLLKPGDLVLGLGAGNINVLLSDVIEEFKKCNCGI